VVVITMCSWPYAPSMPRASGHARSAVTVDAVEQHPGRLGLDELVDEWMTSLRI
jgi:hypothetical protein